MADKLSVFLKKWNSTIFGEILWFFWDLVGKYYFATCESQVLQNKMQESRQEFIIWSNRQWVSHNLLILYQYQIGFYSCICMEWITNHGHIAWYLSAEISETLLLYMNTHTHTEVAYLRASGVLRCSLSWLLLCHRRNCEGHTLLWNKIINCLLLKHMNAHTRARAHRNGKYETL